jgi:hypothetical protein
MSSPACGAVFNALCWSVRQVVLLLLLLLPDIAPAAAAAAAAAVFPAVCR